MQVLITLQPKNMTNKPFIALVLCVTLAFTACQTQDKSTPKGAVVFIPNPIAEDSMTTILTELQLAESAVGLAPLNYALQVARYKQYEQNIFKKYGVDSARYFASYAHYAQDVKLLKKMYITAFDTIMLRKAAVDSLVKKTTGIAPAPMPNFNANMIR
jgi:hypothetical protein